MKRPERWSDKKRRVGQDLDAELAFHFEKSVEELMRTGLERVAAEREAPLQALRAE